MATEFYSDYTGQQIDEAVGIALAWFESGYVTTNINGIANIVFERSYSEIPNVILMPYNTTDGEVVFANISAQSTTGVTVKAFVGNQITYTDSNNDGSIVISGRVKVASNTKIYWIAVK